MMEAIDHRITDFIAKHHVFTLATSHQNIPYTCSCFYVYNKSDNTFVFTSDPDTRHAAEMAQQPNVSVCIALETRIVGKIQGVQITGKAYPVGDEQYKEAHKLYTKAFPIANLKKLDLWVLYPDFIKMTHNQLGFGKKLIWQK